MSLWSRLRVMMLFLQLLRDPNRTDLIFRGVAIFSRDPHRGPVQDIEQFVLAQDQFKTMYEQKYVPEPPSLAWLAQLPENSFGYALYQHMDRNALDFSLFPRLDGTRPVHYLSTRIYQDHDLWHALLGYGVSVEDELAIQAFGVAQFRSPIGLMLIAGGILHLLSKSPARAVAAFRQINEGYDQGQKSPFLLGLRLHEMFHQPLSEVRKICQVGL